MLSPPSRFALKTTTFVPSACWSDGKRTPWHPAVIAISDSHQDVGALRSNRAIFRHWQSHSAHFESQTGDQIPLQVNDRIKSDSVRGVAGGVIEAA